MEEMDYYSPALSVTSDMTDEELDKYFATYVPLSNLPTPPPAKESLPKHSKPTTSPATSQYQAHATHLANLVPTTHGDVICGFLERANLPDEVVAFAACVLEGLSVRFLGAWRDAMTPMVSEDGLIPTPNNNTYHHAQPSTDIIPLAALSLAHGWLSDRLRSSRHWSIKESACMFSVKEIEATKRAMLVDLDYGLYKIQDEKVEKMLGEMRRGEKRRERRNTLSIDLKGTAIWSHGVQTPEPSP